MSRNEVSKSDWKHFNVVRGNALERLCTRVLDNVCKTASDEAKTPHERFLSIYELVNESNQDVARGFDFLSRSRMLLQLAAMQSMNLLVPSEVAGFSQEVQDRLKVFASLDS